MTPLQAVDRLALAALRQFVSLWVRPRVLPDDVAAQVAASGRRACYVFAARAVVDMVVLESICRSRGMPLPLDPLPAAGPQARSLIALERRTGIFRSRIDRRIPPELSNLVQAAAADPQLDVELVPVGFYWGRAPQKESSWLRLLVSESWDLVGRFRRLMSVVINGRNLLVQFGPPVSLRAVVDEGPDAAHAIRRVARQLRGDLRHQRSATIGPDLSHKRTIVAQVLRTRAVREAIAAEMKARGLTRREAIRIAKRYADEIAANYSHAFVSFMSRALTRLWTRLYDGVEFHHKEILQRVADGTEIVYVPCHRSHMDYLLLSWVVYHHGFAVPHIAAGINLNMPGVGPFLRRGGAFFLRRSFRGNTLYTAVFGKYLGIMMARGHPLEYFVEGGRSRTGRLMQPKTGMLSMTVRSYGREPRRPLVFLPVYFGYEKLVEGKTYIGELSGQPKQRESVFAMLRAIPQLRSRFGKVQVSLGEPVHLDAVLAEFAPDWRREGMAGDARPPWLGRVVDALALRIMTNINSAAAVSPINLVALVLLSTPRQSMLEADLTRQLELYASMMRQAPYSPLVRVTDMDGLSMVKYGEGMGVLERVRHPLGDIVRMSEENAILMTYFRNNILHLIAMPSLIACCFLNNRAMRTDDIYRLAWRIYPYIRDELFMRWEEEEIAQVVSEVLEDLANHGLLESVDGGAEWRRPPTGSVEAVQLSVLAQVTVQIIERYYLAVALLAKSGSGRLSQETLENQCRLMAQRMSLLYELASPEFFDKALFKNFIDLLRARNVLGINAEGKLTYTEMLLAVSSDAELVLHEQIRNSVLQVTHR